MNHHHPKRHHHHHAHANDRGWVGFLRYASMLPKMWSSPVSTAVVALVDPKPGETVLEIGAGMGAAAVVAAKSGARVIATDPTPYMRRVLRVRLALMPRRNVEVADGSAEAIPAPDGGVDAVWSVNTMHHWGDLERALQEIRRVLRPGGRLVLVDEDFEDPRHPSHEAHRRRRKAHRHAFTHVDPAAMAASLGRLGFTAVTGGAELVAGRPAKIVRAVRGA